MVHFIWPQDALGKLCLMEVVRPHLRQSNTVSHGHLMTMVPSKTPCEGHLSQSPSMHDAALLALNGHESSQSASVRVLICCV